MSKKKMTNNNKNNDTTLPDEPITEALLYDPARGTVCGKRKVHNGDDLAKGKSAVEEFINIDENDAPAQLQEDIKMLFKKYNIKSGMFIGVAEDEDGSLASVSSEFGLETPEYTMFTANAAGQTLARLHLEKLCQMENYKLCLSVMKVITEQFQTGQLVNLSDIDRHAIANVVKQLDAKKHKSSADKPSKGKK